ncbi:efflux RND transporter periplasmic adaptor subunit [Pacificimonas sp. ICDLI1SI03]
MSATRNPLAWLAIPLLFALANCSESPPPPPAAPVVSVSEPLQRDVRDWDEYIGRFEAIDDVEVKPRISGQIEEIFVNDGQDVAKGDPLFSIDARPFRAALAEANASLASAEASRANAQTELERAESLQAVEAISAEELEQKQTAVRTAAAAVEGARANVATQRLNVSFTTVRAPIAGRVSARRISPGDYVTEGQTVLTRLVSINPIWFAFDGAESFYLKYIRQDREGQRSSSRYAANPVEISLADENDYSWRGRMDFVDNAIDPQSGTIRAHAVVQNPDGFLTPGMFGRARLLGSGVYEALLVPDEAIVTDQDRKLAYVVNRENKVAPRPVETGPMVEGLRVVREGLAPTDRVILDGLTRVQPGMEVQPKPVKLRPRAENDAPAARSASPETPDAAAPTGSAPTEAATDSASSADE